MTATGTEFVTLNQLKLFGGSVSSNSTEVDDITIGYTSDNKLQVKDGGVTSSKLADGSVGTSALGDVVDGTTISKNEFGEIQVEGMVDGVLSPEHGGTGSANAKPFYSVFKNEAREILNTFYNPWIKGRAGMLFKFNNDGNYNVQKDYNSVFFSRDGTFYGAGVHNTGNRLEPHIIKNSPELVLSESCVFDCPFAPSGHSFFVGEVSDGSFTIGAIVYSKDTAPYVAVCVAKISEEGVVSPSVYNAPISDRPIGQSGTYAVNVYPRYVAASVRGTGDVGVAFVRNLYSNAASELLVSTVALSNEGVVSAVQKEWSREDVSFVAGYGNSYSTCYLSTDGMLRINIPNTSSIESIDFQQTETFAKDSSYKFRNDSTSLHDIEQQSFARALSTQSVFEGLSGEYEGIRFVKSYMGGSSMRFYSAILVSRDSVDAESTGIGFVTPLGGLLQSSQANGGFGSNTYSEYNNTPFQAWSPVARTNMFYVDNGFLDISDGYSVGVLSFYPFGEGSASGIEGVLVSFCPDDDEGPSMRMYTPKIDSTESQAIIVLRKGAL